jgi:hypothetical protein
MTLGKQEVLKMNRTKQTAEKPEEKPKQKDGSKEWRMMPSTPRKRIKPKTGTSTRLRKGIKENRMKPIPKKRSSRPALSRCKVKLLGTDGNAFAIMAKVRTALRMAGRTDLIQPYFKEATSGNYDHLLQVTMKYVDIE